MSVKSFCSLVTLVVAVIVWVIMPTSKSFDSDSFTSPALETMESKTMPTLQELASIFEEFLRNQEELKLEADIEVAVSSGYLPPKGSSIALAREMRKLWERESGGETFFGNDTVKVYGGDAFVEASMTQTSFDVSMWDYSITSDYPTLTLTFVSEPAPTITEAHWRSPENVEVVSYKASPYGLPGDLNLPSYFLGKSNSDGSVFGKFDTELCAFTEFFSTWLGKGSPQAGHFIRNISNSETVSAEEFGDVSVYEVSSGEDYVRDWGDGTFSYRTDKFFLEVSPPHRLVGWEITKSYSDPTNGRFDGHYYLMTYRYVEE